MLGLLSSTMHAVVGSGTAQLSVLCKSYLFVSIISLFLDISGALPYDIMLF